MKDIPKMQPFRVIHSERAQQTVNVSSPEARSMGVNRIGQFIFAPLHSEGGVPECRGSPVPPSQPNFFPPMPILVEEMQPFRKPCSGPFSKISTAA